MSRYGFGITVTLPFDRSVGRVKEALQAEGFGTLTEIDVQKTLHEKTGEVIKPYVILGVCNPRLASRAIAAEPEIGLLLPCNVLVRDTGAAVQVSVQDPLLMVEVTGNAALRPLAEEARERLERALQALGEERAS
jgi:uncharacterized protein (DUF302 family)